MKDLKRAYRRYKKEVHFKRRAKNVYPWMGYSSAEHEQHLSWAEYWNKIQSGERATWLRTTGRPCNCTMCTEYYKYKRPKKGDITKIINSQIMDSAQDELDRLLGKTKPSVHNCIIAKCDDGISYLIQSKPELDSDFYSGLELEDILTTKDENFPTEPGIYSAVLFVESYRCNHHEDPEEWDMNIWMEDVKKIDIPLT